MRLITAFSIVALAAGSLMAAEPVTKLETAPPATAPAVTVEAIQVEAPAAEVDSDCEEATFTSATADATLEAAVASSDSQLVAAGCRKCDGRPWCKCTYNGMHRYSCDPCCYTNDIGGIIVCLD